MMDANMLMAQQLTPHALPNTNKTPFVKRVNKIVSMKMNK